MALPFGSRVKNAWNYFWNARDPTKETAQVLNHVTTSVRPDRVSYTQGTERTIIASVFNRIATDVSTVDIKHVRLDDNGRFTEVVDDGLNTCLTTEANIDQTGRFMIHDAVSMLLSEGSVAIVPVDTTDDPETTDSYDILSLRVGQILEWSPERVKVDLYNDATGHHEQLWLHKRCVAIVENPFYSVMNQPNSTLKRLVRKLNLLDKIDNAIGSNKLDMIIQLPYLARTEAKKKIAEDRRNEIEQQLIGSQYGIAWIDATEKITQLNRPIENTLLGQIEFLTNLLYSQIGFSQAILDGTADEKTMLNYNNRIVNVLLLAITEEMQRKFLSKTARSQRHAIWYFNDPFRLVPITSIPDIADKLTRNEIMSSNEIRQIIGLKPSKDPEADELRNKNLNKANEGKGGMSTEEIVAQVLRKLDGKDEITEEDVRSTVNQSRRIQNEEE